MKASCILSKNRIELLWDVSLLCVLLLLPHSHHHIGVCFAIGVCWRQICSLEYTKDTAVHSCGAQPAQRTLHRPDTTPTHLVRSLKQLPQQWNSHLFPHKSSSCKPVISSAVDPSTCLWSQGRCEKPRNAHLPILKLQSMEDSTEGI